MAAIPMFLPLTTAFGDTPDVLRARLAAAANSTMPHAYRAGVTTLEVSFDELAGDDTCVSSVCEADGQRWEVLLGGDDWLVLVTRADSRLGFHAQGATPAAARTATEAVLERLHAPAPAADDPSSVLMEFCHTGSRGLKLSRRRVSCPDWGELAGNYPAGAEDALGRLAELREPQAGRLILLWGAPGTGKTTAVRALTRRWAPWCRSVYVLDPEHLFASSDYFHELIIDGETNLDDDDDRAPVPPWRLLVIEDADEVVRGDARSRSGQALGRLLNLTDGIVGQGMRTMVLITTNEPLTELHPALVRPGRCLAQVEIGPLSPGEVRRWLEHAGRDPRELPGPATLAELYALGGYGPVEARTAPGSGCGYL